MGSSGTSYKAPKPDKTGLEEQTLSTAQEAKPLPLLFGTRKVALTWITPVYDQFVKDAPVKMPGKK